MISISVTCFPQKLLVLKVQKVLQISILMFACISPNIWKPSPFRSGPPTESPKLLFCVLCRIVGYVNVCRKIPANGAKDRGAACLFFFRSAKIEVLRKCWNFAVDFLLCCLLRHAPSFFFTDTDPLQIHRTRCWQWK